MWVDVHYRIPYLAVAVASLVLCGYHRVVRVLRKPRRYSGGKPTLIFCGSKKDTETVAAELAKKDYAASGRSQACLDYDIYV